MTDIDISRRYLTKAAESGADPNWDIVFALRADLDAETSAHAKTQAALRAFIADLDAPKDE